MAEVVFERIAPVLTVHDLEAALARCGRVGFATEIDEHAPYGFVRRGAVEHRLAPDDVDDPGGTGAVVYVYVCDAEAVQAEWTSAGVEVSSSTRTRTASCIESARHSDADQHRQESGGRNMQVEFVTSVAVIATNPAESRRLYVDAFGLPLKQLDGEYFASEEIGGCKHFGVWPLEQAAQACFGTTSWPADIRVPQVSLEFEVADADAVAAGADELRSRGYQLLHDAREEPWGQTVARLISPEGAVVGVSYAPSLHEGPVGRG